MTGSSRSSVLGCSLAVVVLLATSLTLLSSPKSETAHPGLGLSAGPTTLPGKTLVAAPPAGAKGPDDITRLSVGGLDSGRPLVWTAFQNGVNANGTPGTPFGPTQSTVAGFDPLTGGLVRAINVSGKVDGLTADLRTGLLLATANEDANSLFNVINPATGAVTAYRYTPSLEVSGNGGTDSIAILGSEVFVVHSNPNDTTQASSYRVTLHPATLTAELAPVFYDDGSATDALTHAPVTLALTDPDTNLIMPGSSPRFAGNLATISQGDGLIVFADHPQSHANLNVLRVTDNVTGNVPPIDGLAVATADEGTLFVVDAKAGTIQALDTAGWPKGTVFVGEPSDNGNPLLGTLNLLTGVISPLGNHFVSPKGLLFVPHGDDDRDHGTHGHHHGDEGNGGGFDLGISEARRIARLL